MCTSRETPRLKHDIQGLGSWLKQERQSCRQQGIASKTRHAAPATIDRYAPSTGRQPQPQYCCLPLLLPTAENKQGNRLRGGPWRCWSNWLTGAGNPSKVDKTPPRRTDTQARRAGPRTRCKFPPLVTLLPPAPPPPSRRYHRPASGLALKRPRGSGCHEDVRPQQGTTQTIRGACGGRWMEPDYFLCCVQKA